MLESLFNKVVDLLHEILINFAKFLRTPILQKAPGDCFRYFKNLTFKLLILNKFVHSINIVGTLYLISKNIGLGFYDPW